MQYVKPLTSDHELIELAKKVNVHLDDILTIDEIKKPLPKKGSYILLLRAQPTVGHWVAYHDGEYFDSTGIGPPTRLGDLPYNEYQIQGTYGEYCGPFCILWLYSRQKNKPELMKDFIDLDIDAI